MKDKILITGSTGYLGKHIMNYIDAEFIIVHERFNDLNIFDYSDLNIDYVFHIGGPNKVMGHDNEMYSSIVDGTNKIIDLSILLDAKLVYFSTMGIYNVSNIYERYKLEATLNIINKSNSYKILLVPRVYSSDRSDGLIGRLKVKLVNRGDFLKKIIYSDLDDFLYRVSSCYKLDTKIDRFNNVKSSILDIKLKYTID